MRLDSCAQDLSLDSTSSHHTLDLVSYFRRCVPNHLPGDNLVWPDSKKPGADGWGPEKEEVFEIRELWPEESPKLNRLMQDMSMSFSFEY